MSQVSREITDIDFSPQNSKFFWKELFEKGIQHLLDEQKKGFINTKHSMVFSKEIFQVEETVQRLLAVQCGHGLYKRGEGCVAAGLVRWSQGDSHQVTKVDLQLVTAQ